MPYHVERHHTSRKLVFTGSLVIMALALLGAAAWIGYRATRHHDTIAFGSRVLDSDFWGVGENETLSGNVYLNKDGTFGWDWQREDPTPRAGTTAILPIYPNVRVGDGFGEKSTSKFLPIRAGEISGLKFDVAYKYLTAPSGEYNFAYEMDFGDSKRPAAGTAPKAEVMIWIHHTFGQPPDTYQGDFTDGINSYRLYSWTMADGRLYFSFMMVGDPLLSSEHTVDAKRLLDKLTLNPNWYLLGIQLGNEVLDGSGKIEIDKYSLELNGHRL